MSRSKQGDYRGFHLPSNWNDFTGHDWTVCFKAPVISVEQSKTPISATPYLNSIQDNLVEVAFSFFLGIFIL